MSDKAKFSSIRDFMVRNNFVSVHNAVRTNVSDYPFVTFISSIIDPATNKVKAENIYFSKASSLLVAKDTPVTKELFGSLIISEYLTDKGEPRIKLASQGESSRVSVDDLF